MFEMLIFVIVIVCCENRVNVFVSLMGCEFILMVRFVVVNVVCFDDLDVYDLK